jgi:hypothetical protein
MTRALSSLFGGTSSSSYMFHGQLPYPKAICSFRFARQTPVAAISAWNGFRIFYPTKLPLTSYGNRAPSPHFDFTGFQL